MDEGQFKRLCAAALRVAAARGQDYYGWKNAPEADANGTLTHTNGEGITRLVSGPEALEVMKGKINGAYGERFITSLSTIAALIRNGYDVRFVQFNNEPGIPFDAAGWTVLIVETMPIFHISPDDLRLEDVADIVEMLIDNKDPSVSCKKTNKVGEFTALLRGAVEPGLDLVAIAQQASK